VDSLDTPIAVHYALMRLGNACPEEYLRVAFTDLSGWVYSTEEELSEYQITQIAHVLSHRVPLYDLFAIYAKQCSVSQPNILSNSAFAVVLGMAMARHAPDTLHVVIDLLPELTGREATFLLHAIGSESPIGSLEGLLNVPITSELTPEQHATLFTAHEELNRTSQRAYRATRGFYLRNKVYRAYPDRTPEQSLGIVLAGEWHGNSQTLIETVAAIARDES
jgi:hypothetical protein